MIFRSKTIPFLRDLLSHEEMVISREACWTLSNLFAGSEEQVRKLMDFGILEKVIQLCLEGPDDMKKEAIWCVSNCTTHKNQNIISHLLRNQGLEAIFEIFKSLSERIPLTVGLEGLENILACGKDPQGGNSVVRKIEEMDQIEELEKLQTHSDQGVYEKVHKILNEYFVTEDFSQQS